MPWHKVQDHSDCPPGKPWAVVKDSDGSIAGCHAAEADADKQLAALYANEPEAGATDATFHLPGKHDQKSHARGKGKSGGAPKGKGGGGEKPSYRVKKGFAETISATETTSDGTKYNLHASTKFGTPATNNHGVFSESGRHVGDVFKDAPDSYSANHRIGKRGGVTFHGSQNDAVESLHRDTLRSKQRTAGDTDVFDEDDQVDADLSTDVDDTEFGGKPNPGTKKDKRLKKNKTEDDAATFADGDGDCPPGHKRDDAGECVPVSEMARLAWESEKAMADAPSGTWEGVLVVEGVRTGDGRKFAVNSVSWAEPPLPLRWKKEDAHGGQNDVTVSVGRIDNVWRDGPRVMGRGVFDLGSADGAEAHRRMAEGFLKGVSIDADDITDADVELIWPERPDIAAKEAVGEDPDAADVLEMLFMSPEETIFHAGRIRAATLVDIPAFVEAYIKLADVTGEPPLVASAEATSGAVGSHTTGTSDAAWDAGANERRLPATLTSDHARQAYAWVGTSTSDVSRVDCRFLHHEVNPDGTVGPANLTACSAVIGVLHGGRGGTNLPGDQRRAVYNHVAAHLRDAGREPEPYIDDVEALVAHAVGERWSPPRAWFDDPRLGQLVPIVVTDEGRVYGHVAQWGECHIGYTDTCVMTPREDAFPYFLTGELTCDDGGVIAVGQITVDTNHAPLTVRPAVAAEHYDHTGAVVADVTLGNDRHGIWCAGAIRPDADAMRVHKLRASGQVSPDWRRIGGELRMVALLTVNASGYQVPRMQARVAAGEVQSLVAAGMITVGPRESEEQLNRRAMRLLRDQLVARVHPNRQEVNA